MSLFLSVLPVALHRAEMPRKAISLGEKQSILTAIEKGEKQAPVAQRLSLAKTTVSTIWKNREVLKKQTDSDEFGPDRKRARSSKLPDLDAALLEWFRQARSRNIPITGPLLLEKTGSLSGCLGEESFEPTIGFIDRWKARHNICLKAVSGEEGAVSEDVVQPWTAGRPQLLNDYKPENVYNVDETGLFFKLCPDWSLSLRGEKYTGGKKSKERLTVLEGGSIAGEKLPLLVIGKAKKPRCFSGVHCLPLDYEANKRAWMTGDLFREWLAKWNRRLAAAQRDVLLIVDNCPAHPRDLRFTNITMKFFPPNTISKLQPCGQEIIRNLKVHYRHQLMRRALWCMENDRAPTVNVLDAMQWLKVAWDKVTPSTIQNCFRHCGFRLASDEVENLSARRFSCRSRLRSSP